MNILEKDEQEVQLTTAASFISPVKTEPKVMISLEKHSDSLSQDQKNSNTQELVNHSESKSTTDQKILWDPHPIIQILRRINYPQTDPEWEIFKNRLLEAEYDEYLENYEIPDNKVINFFLPPWSSALAVLKADIRRDNIFTSCDAALTYFKKLIGNGIYCGFKPMDYEDWVATGAKEAFWCKGGPIWGLERGNDRAIFLQSPYDRASFALLRIWCNDHESYDKERNWLLLQHLNNHHLRFAEFLLPD